jgi:cell division protease FtsH
MGLTAQSVMRRARRCLPVALLYLVMSQEALAVRQNIQTTKAFIGSARLSRSTETARRSTKSNSFGARAVTMKEGPNFGKVCPSKATLLGVTALGLSAAMGPQVAQAADAAPALQTMNRQPGVPSLVRYSDFLDMVEKGQIEKVTFSADGQKLVATDTDGARYRLDALPNDPDLLATLTQKMVDVTVLPEQAKAEGFNFFQSILFPGLLFLGLFFLARRGGSGAGGGAGPGGMPGMGGQGPMEFSKSSAKIMLTPDTGVTFDNVAGCDGAKMELTEVVDFLKNPEKYTNVGAKIPRGVILDGPPGTGKTLLAKAVAGESGVPFISAAGSEFVEMFVGVGASRVRDMFEQAKKNAPCIIFIDEIDAVGRQRGAGFAGGNDEREQTLNQLLTEMDGFEGNPGIIVIAATNRADVLDQALLRPGRFDRRVTVDLPDFKGRTAILKVHSKGKPLAPDVDLESISRRTPGFSGASLQNIMNEAAISAARADKPDVGWEEIDNAVDRVLVGLEKRGADVPALRKELVAFHEAGHAIVGAVIPDYDMVQKVTIIPRSNGAGGLTFFAPNEDRLESSMYTRQYLEAQLAVALGGRLAEELIFGPDHVTTGAMNDIQQVANIAKRMVTQFGMSDRVGPLGIGESGPVFMGRRMAEGVTEWSQSLKKEVDDEVERLVSNAYNLAKDVLQKNMDLLYGLADRLVEQETVTAEEFAFMLLEYQVQMVPYAVYPNESKMGDLPYYPDQMPDWKSGTNMRFSREVKGRMDRKADEVMGASSRLIGAGGGSGASKAPAAPASSPEAPAE